MLAVIDLEARVLPHHPLRTIKRFADRALATLSLTFDTMYGAGGRPSIPPERLLKASRYSLRSERAFCEELDFQLLWRWFLDISMMEPSFDRYEKSQSTKGPPIWRAATQAPPHADVVRRRSIAN